MIPVETFPALSAIVGLRHAFTGRVPDLDVKVDRDIALQRLEEHHASARATLGLDSQRFLNGEQIHGREIAIVDSATTIPVLGVDGLITVDPAVCLGIHVADCCAVYLADPVRRVIALLHSGRKGTDLGITSAAVSMMRSIFGSDPADIVAQLSPCIRPPHYEVDIAATIRAQCEEAGLRQINDCGTCTASDTTRYYSYRAEKGRTGRMLALLSLG